jgi:hypothetical protein
VGFGRKTYHLATLLQNPWLAEAVIKRHELRFYLATENGKTGDKLDPREMGKKERKFEFSGKVQKMGSPKKV